MNATVTVQRHWVNKGFRTGSRLVELCGKTYAVKFAHWWSWDGYQPVAHTVEGPLFDPLEPDFILAEKDREFEKLLSKARLDYPVYTGQFVNGRWE